MAFKYALNLERGEHISDDNVVVVGGLLLNTTLLMLDHDDPIIKSKGSELCNWECG